MWLVHELERRPSQEVYQFEELIADGEVLSNAVNRVDWSEPEVLLSRCTYCAGDDVNGGWVKLRRSGELVVLQPTFGHPEWIFAPPDPFADKGIAVVAYESLRPLVKQLPQLDEIAAWTADDAILALQFESMLLLGRYPDEPHLATDAVVACSKASLEEGLEALRKCIARFRHSNVPALLEPLPEGEQPVWFYVEGLPPLDWLPIAEVGGIPVPYFAPGLAAITR